jgi:hypothetical protein
MASVKYELKAKSGTYKTKEGEEKPNWVKMGVCFESDKGLSLKIDTIPVGWDGWISMFPPRPKDSDPFAGMVNIKDDVPF